MFKSLIASLLLLSVSARADFVSSLSPAERQSLGLDQLSAEQLSRLNTAVETYRQEGEKSAAANASEQVRREQNAPESFSAVVKGKFRGWSGGTLFELENGQVWKQVGTDQYVLPSTTGATVEIAKSEHGYHRLRLKDGAWVNVKRLK